MIFFVTFSLCIVFCRWGEILSSYNKFLKFYLKEKTIKKNNDIFKDFFEIIKLLHKLDKALAYPSFLIIFNALELVFMSLYAIMTHRSAMEENPANFIEFLFNNVCGFLIVLMYSFSASIIPEKITKIKKTAKEHINSYSENNPIHCQVIFYLRRIEAEDIVHISACGMFHLTRKFILTAMGATLTYDLLIINLNF